MYILDTDHMSALEWNSSHANQRLRARLAHLPTSQVVTTIVTYEEQTRGWLAVLARSHSIEEQIAAYSRLKRTLQNYLEIPVLDFDAAAAARFKQILLVRPRIGTMDLKIAAIAFAHRAIVLTKNLKDFTRIPNLSVEDWTT